MIQFNLLPDIKLQYIRSRRLKRMAVLSSSAVVIAAVTISVILVLVVDVWQKHEISRVTTDITKQSNALKSVPELNKVLTIQNQLSSLPALHDKEPRATKLIGYISQVTPNQVSISQLALDFTKNTITLTGATDTLETVNRFVDTLKFSTYTIDSTNTSVTTSQVGSSPTATKAFTGVVLTSFGIATGTNKATYTINLSFDPNLFDTTKNVTLTVPPNFITTRSQIDEPNNALFQVNPTPPVNTKK